MQTSNTDNSTANKKPADRGGFGEGYLFGLLSVVIGAV